MKYQEFIDVKSRYETARKKVLLVALVIAFGAIGFFILVAFLQPQLLDTRFPSAFGVVAIMALAFSILYFEKSVAKMCGLVCPSCKVPFSADEIKIVTSTRNCTHCGKTVFSEEI